MPYSSYRGSRPAGILGTLSARNRGFIRRASKLGTSPFFTGKWGTGGTKSKFLGSRKLALRGWTNSPGEVKYLDVAVAAYAADTTGTVTALNLTAVGDDNNTRDGRQINNKSIHIQGTLAPVDSATTDSFCRLLIVWDQAPNSGTIATITDILTAATASSFTNLNNRDRFTILRDARYALGRQDTAAGGSVGYTSSPSMFCINEFVKLDGKKTTYSGTTAVIGSVATGALLMVTIGTTAAGAGGSFALNTRLRYTDN